MSKSCCDLQPRGERSPGDTRCPGRRNHRQAHFKCISADAAAPSWLAAPSSVSTAGP